MKLLTLSFAAAATCMLAQSAQAREHHRHHARHRQDVRHHEEMRHHEARSHRLSRRYALRIRHRHYAQESDDYSARGYAVAEPVARRRGLGGRPSAWCGWEMRQLVGSDPGPEFNLARNWAHWGHAGPAAVGAVVVWSHHVGKIVGQEGGEWIIESGNDGHRLRTRPRSIAGAIAIRWG